jgi:shikimate kinase
MNPPHPLRLFLAGFLACGKTTLGQVLAREMDVPFFDIDQALVEQEGMPVLHILATKGEPYFRGLERALLGRLPSMERVIVATGSGTPASLENLRIISGMGEMVFLHTPWNVIAARLESKDAVLPPDLPVKVLYQTYLQRLPFYLKSRWVVVPEAGETAEALTLRIRMLLKEAALCAI